MSVSFRSKLLLSHVAVALAVAVVALLVTERSMSNRLEELVDSRLVEQGRAVARWVDRSGHPNNLAPRLAGVVDARVTMLGGDGMVLGDSLDPTLAAQKEIVPPTEGFEMARAGGVGKMTTFSEGLNQEVRFVFMPSTGGNVVRIGYALGEVEETRTVVRRQIVLGAGASLLVAGALALLVAAALSRRLSEASALASRIARGEYDATHANVPLDDEVGLVARTLADAAGELRAADEQRRAFLANVTHELRTPVTSISGYTETLANSDLDVETRREFIDTIHRNAQRLARLVDDLLELEALAAGKGAPVDREPVALDPVVELAVKTMRSRIEEQGATVETGVGADARVLGDSAAVERVVLNLVGNAVLHGGTGVTVRIASRREDDRVILRVADNGPGIPLDRRRLVFERFMRAGDAKKATKGTGLGLPIARELAHAMGGTLNLVDSDKGAAFELVLPAAP